MPNSLSKNKKDERSVIQMFNSAFPNKGIQSIHELTEGFFNVAYSITTTDGEEVILKIAPSPETDVMTHEINIMYSEVDCMKRVEKETSVPVAQILYYDSSHRVCESDFFFMSKLKGRSFNSCSEKMTDQEKYQVQFKMGEYTAEINRIQGDKFGYYGQPDKQGDHWFTVFQSMIMDTYHDANRKNIEVVVPRERLLDFLERDRILFEEVDVPKLIHWDIWPGNVFIDNNQVTGIIDFERCLWGDELLEVGFRTCWCEKAFLDGYGIEELTPAQLRRAQWYDIYLFLLVCLECDYRTYDDRGMYEWGSKMLLKSIENVKNPSI